MNLIYIDPKLEHFGNIGTTFPILGGTFQNWDELNTPLACGKVGKFSTFSNISAISKLVNELLRIA